MATLLRRSCIMAETLIRLNEVGRVFRADETETHALAGVSLSVERGEFVAISGPSGCGKTTLLSILGLLDSPTSGEYLLGGEAVAGLSPARKAELRNRSIGFVFQNFNLIGNLTALDNVELPLVYRGLAAKERRDRAAAALARAGMSDREGHYPSQLSGGQQQRVAMARAIAGKPLVLLADEPTGNLDSANGSAVVGLLGELHREGTTICMVTHDPDHAAAAGRTLRLFDGRIVRPGFPARPGGARNGS